MLISIDFRRAKEEMGTVSVIPKMVLPTRFMLYYNYPNPVRRYTFIRFDLPRKSRLSLNIYNLKGQMVTRIIKPQTIFNPGKYKVLWKGTNEMGQLLPTGQYIYRIRTKGYAKARKMIIVR